MSRLSEVKSKLELLKPELMEKYPLAFIGIFGSVARGEDTDESDIDILVDFTGPIGIRFIDLAEELEQKLGRRVDLVSRRGFRESRYKYIEPDIVYV
jgi:predicted nucleotidyltransferase